MGLEDHRQRLVSSGYQWGDRPGEAIANDDLDDSRAPPNPNLERGAAAFDALCDHMNSRHPPAASISLKAPTTVGWSLEKLVSRSENFHHIRRVSATSTDLHTHIANYERDGIPLVIEGWHKHQYWPANLFDVDWFIRYGSQRMSVRNIHNWRDSTISLSEFIQKSRSSPPFIVQDETERLYGKDAECPEQWNKWLREGGAIPSSLLSGGPEDYLRNLPKLNRVETLMCYLGIGDTFTPCHKDLCASSGQNLMCYTENDGCSFWFMTESSSALDVSKYFHSLNQELDHETHVITIDELAKAPFTVYIAQQKLGDLVLVPPRSSHQVVNYGGLTIKTSWSRMTLKGLETAYYHELPLYRRVCRPEIYCVKLTIHHSLNRIVKELENDYPIPATTKSPAASKSLRTQKSSTKRDPSDERIRSLQQLLTLYDSIIVEEYCADHNKLPRLHPASPSTAGPLTTMPKEEDRITCDFCGSDVFQSFFECRTCTSAQAGSAGKIRQGDGYIVCPGCFTEGRTCHCKSMEALQCRDLEFLLHNRRNAIRVLDVLRAIALPDIPWPRAEIDLLHEGQLGIFRAARVLQQQVLFGKGLTCSRQHPILSERALSCKKCHSTKCFSHVLADCYIHSASALHLYSQDKTHQDCHNYHLSNRSKFAGQYASYLQSTQQGSQPDLGFQLAHLAVEFNKCKPLKAMPLQLGWYDIYAEIPEVINIDTNKRTEVDWDCDVDLSPLSSLAPSRTASPFPVSVILPSHSAMPTTKNPLVPGFVAHTPRTILSTIPGKPDTKGKRKMIDFVDMPLPPQSKKTKPTKSAQEQGINSIHSTDLGPLSQAREKPRPLSKRHKSLLVPKAKCAPASNKPDNPQSSGLRTFEEVFTTVEPLILQKQEQAAPPKSTKKKSLTTARPASKRKPMEVPKRHSSPSWDDRPLKSLPQRPSNSTLAKASRQPAPAHSFSPSTSSTATLDNSVTNALNFAIFENDRMLMDSRTSSPSQASPNHFPKHHREPPSLDSQANLEDLNRKLEAMQARIHTMERTAADEKTQHLTDRVRDLQQVFSVAQPVIQPTYIAPSTFQPGVPYLVNPQPIHPQAVYYSPPPEYSNNGSYYGGGPSQPWPNHPQGYPPNAPQYAPQSHPIYYPSHHPQSHPIGYQPPHQSYPMGPQPHMPPQPPPQFQPHLPPQLPPQFQSPGRFQPLRSQPPHRAPPTHPRDMGRNAHYPQEGRKDGPRQPGNGRFPWGGNYSIPAALPGGSRNMGPVRGANHPNNAMHVPINRPFNNHNFHKQQKLERKQKFCANNNGNRTNANQGRPTNTNNGTPSIDQSKPIGNNSNRSYGKRGAATNIKRDGVPNARPGKPIDTGDDNRPRTPQDNPTHEDDDEGDANRDTDRHHSYIEDSGRSNQPGTSQSQDEPPLPLSRRVSAAPSSHASWYSPATPERTNHLEQQSERHEPTSDPEEDANWEQTYDRDEL